MLHIYCPYCGSPYDIDETALPAESVKVRCRVCSNVFILNKTGAFKDIDIKDTQNNPDIRVISDENDASFQNSDNLVDDANERETQSAQSKEQEDVMRSIMEMIGSPAEVEVKKESGEKQNPKYSAKKPVKDKNKKGPGTVQIIMLVILILVFLMSAVYALNHYGIINIDGISQLSFINGF